MARDSSCKRDMAGCGWKELDHEHDCTSGVLESLSGLWEDFSFLAEWWLLDYAKKERGALVRMSVH